MELGLAIASTKATLELLSGAIKARDSAKIEAATLELRERLFAMSDVAMSYIEKNASLIAANSELKLAHAEQLRAYAELKDKARDRESYVLHEARPGAFVYALEPEVDEPAKPPYFCQVCYDGGSKSVLRFLERSHSHGDIWQCPKDSKHSFDLAGQMPTTAVHRTNPFVG